LTAREYEVLRLLVDGHTDNEIAELLFISRRTAEGHVRALCRKLGARSRAAAVAMALAGGLVDPPSPPQPSPSDHA
jgi:DNA-binding CsgD family transcriptional regulator